MNALTTIKPAYDLAASTEAANDWLRVARPVIKVWYALDDLQGDLSRAGYDFRGNKRWNEPHTYEERVMDEARGCLNRPLDDLFKMLDGIRSDFLADQMPPQPNSDAPEQDWEDRDEFSEALETTVLSVADAVKRVEDEL